MSRNSSSRRSLAPAVIQCFWMATPLDEGLAMTKEPKRLLENNLMGVKQLMFFLKQGWGLLRWTRGRLPYAANLEKLALPSIEKIVNAVKEVCWKRG